MADYRQPITIYELIEGIIRNTYLLPAIQRKFVWKDEQIESLFDSIMQGYPINTMMLWDIESPEIYNNQRFYQVLTNFQERFQENNPRFNTIGDKGFKAIIDGQQRITAFNIGLRGSYASKKPRVWWPPTYNSDDLPKRKLYLDLKHLKHREDEDNERQIMYDFRFLTDDEANNRLEKINNPKTPYWYEVAEIRTFEKIVDVVEVDEMLTEYLNEKGLEGNKIARSTLNKLYHNIFHRPLIHYYEVTDQDSNKILEIFVRTNKGGTQLTYSDIIMSAGVSYWERDIKEEIDELVKLIRTDIKYGFSIDSDFVLQTFLMLVDTTIRFRLEYFGENEAKRVEEEWDDISECIKEAFILVKTFGISDRGLKAKNAVIPIIYYLYNKNIDGKKYYEVINHPEKYRDDKKLIRNWLFLSLLKQVFGGQGQAVLEGLRAIIKENITQDTFPLEAIREKYKGSTKDLMMDEDFKEKLLETQYGDSNCLTILALIFPDFNFRNDFHIDHVHPKSQFRKEELNKFKFLEENPEKRAFYENKKNWNSIVNLQPLDQILNSEKGDSSLKSWFERSENIITKEGLLVSDNTDLSFEEFENFIADRKNIMKTRLRNILK